MGFRLMFEWGAVSGKPLARRGTWDLYILPSYLNVCCPKRGGTVERVGVQSAPGAVRLEARGGTRAG